MSLEILETFFEIFKNYTGYIHLGSGENTISKHLKNIIYWANHSKIKQLIILSNGRNLNLDNPLYYSGKILWGVTMDGFMNNEISGLQHGLDIELVKNNILTIKSRFPNSKFYLNYTLTTVNINSIIELIKFASLANIKMVYISNLRVYKKYNFEYMKNFTVDCKDKKIVRILNEADNFASLLNVILSYPLIDDIVCNCKCNYKPIISTNGNISFCSGREDVVIGNICEDNFLRKWDKIEKHYHNNLRYKKHWCSKCNNNKVEDINIYNLPFNELSYKQK